MASMVAKGCSSNSCQLPSSMSPVQEKKGSRNKRKFRAEPPLVDPNKMLPSVCNDSQGYEFSAEKYEVIQGHGSSGGCDMCGGGQDHSDALKLDLALPSSAGIVQMGLNRSREDIDGDEFHDADWSDFTESQLEELVLSNLDTIFKSAIKKIIACGYAEEVAMKAILRSGLCYGCKDTVSNVVDNTLAYLKNGQQIDPSREYSFDDLQQLEKYILAELVCVLREVRPFFSIGDAMWCLLICDMNVSHACAMDGDPLISALGDDEGVSNSGLPVPADPQLKKEAQSSEVNPLDPCKTTPLNSVRSEVPSTAGSSKQTKQKKFLLNGQASDKHKSVAASDRTDKSFSLVKTTQSPSLEEKFTTSRKVHSTSTKRDAVLRQKSFHLEKNYRAYGSKGGRAGKLSGFGGLILDKKLKQVQDFTGITIKPLSDSTSITVKSTSVKISRAVTVDVPQENGKHHPSPKVGPSSPAAPNVEYISTVSTFPKICTPSTSPFLNNLPALPAPASPTTDTELSLSLPNKCSSALVPGNGRAETPNGRNAGVPFDKSLGYLVPRDKKDEMIMKMVPRVRELHNQLQEWTEWANQKVMQAARRLSKDKVELRTLRQDRDEVERLKREKKTLEENTMKKLSEMENALCKASGQVDRANAAVRRLEVENAALRHEMEAAKVRAAESAASCQEVSKREKKTVMKFQSWEKQKTLFQEELSLEKRRVAQFQQELQRAKERYSQVEARLGHEEKAKEGLLAEARSLKKEREQVEASAKSKEDAIKSKAENSLQRYKDETRRLEKEVSQIRMKTDSVKIAALRRGIDGSYASKLADARNPPAQKAPDAAGSTTIQAYSGNGGVKRERECVMCLSEEMSVVFIPCAHQVVCKNCNELHEKQGMKDCPSCRSPIERRIAVRYARP